MKRTNTCNTTLIHHKSSGELKIYMARYLQSGTVLLVIYLQTLLWSSCSVRQAIGRAQASKIPTIIWVRDDYVLYIFLCLIFYMFYIVLYNKKLRIHLPNHPQIYVFIRFQQNHEIASTHYN